MSAESRVKIVTTTCRRCDWPFRYVNRGGRRRYYCEGCRELEAMDANDARPRKTTQTRPGIRLLRGPKARRQSLFHCQETA